MDRWPYKTDEAGAPRRFLSHREAASWTARKVGKYAGAFALCVVLGSTLRRADEYSVPALAYNAAIVAALALFGGLVVAVGLYLYIALYGGVMNRAERRRYREGRGYSRDT
jgi:hypothetical protein